MKLIPRPRLNSPPIAAEKEKEKENKKKRKTKKKTDKIS